MPVAILRVYAELNDFLPPSLRQRPFPYEFLGSPAVKDVIETIGVPHTEVELVLCEGESVGFSRRVYGGEKLSVFPVFESFDIAELLRVRRRPLRRTRFLADGHLGRLARYLRLLGFDTRWHNHAHDAWLAQCSREEHRILLTRDRGLLKRKAVTHGYYVRSAQPGQQAAEVLNRFQLHQASRPFSRSLCCNQPLVAVEPPAAAQLVPARVWQRHKSYKSFFRCPGCNKLFWPGTHYERMCVFIRSLGVEWEEKEQPPYREPEDPG